MSSKRIFVEKTDSNGRKSQVGGGSKTVAKAAALRQRMKDQQSKGSSASFSLKPGKK